MISENPFKYKLRVSKTNKVLLKIKKDMGEDKWERFLKEIIAIHSENNKGWLLHQITTFCSFMERV